MNPGQGPLNRSRILFQSCSCSLRRVAIELLNVPLTMFWMLSRNIDRCVRKRMSATYKSLVRPRRMAGCEGVHGGFATQDWKTSRNNKVYDPSQDKADPDAKEQLMKYLAEDDKGMSQNVEFILSLKTNSLQRQSIVRGNCLLDLGAGNKACSKNPNL